MILRSTSEKAPDKVPKRGDSVGTRGTNNTACASSSFPAARRSPATTQPPGTLRAQTPRKLQPLQCPAFSFLIGGSALVLPPLSSRLFQQVSGFPTAGGVGKSLTFRAPEVGTRPRSAPPFPGTPSPASAPLSPSAPTPHLLSAGGSRGRSPRCDVGDQGKAGTGTFPPPCGHRAPERPAGGDRGADVHRPPQLRLCPARGARTLRRDLGPPGRWCAPSRPRGASLGSWGAGPNSSPRAPRFQTSIAREVAATRPRPFLGGGHRARRSPAPPPSPSTHRPDLGQQGGARRGGAERGRSAPLTPLQPRGRRCGSAPRAWRPRSSPAAGKVTLSGSPRLRPPPDIAPNAAPAREAGGMRPRAAPRTPAPRGELPSGLARSPAGLGGRGAGGMPGSRGYQ